MDNSLPSMLLLDSCSSSQDPLESLISELKETDVHGGLGDGMVPVIGGDGMGGAWKESPYPTPFSANDKLRFRATHFIFMASVTYHDTTCGNCWRTY